MSLITLFNSLRLSVPKNIGILSRLSSSAVTSVANEDKEAHEIIDEVNKLAAEKVSRNFAIVHVMGKQFRVTDGDLIMLEGFWPPNLGDQLKLEKVLLAGTRDFTLIGRPLVQPGLVNVLATVIGKGTSHTKTRFRKKPKKQFMRINFVKEHLTTLRINCIDIKPTLNRPDYFVN